MAIEYSALELIKACNQSDIRLNHLKLRLQKYGFSEDISKNFYDLI